MSSINKVILVGNVANVPDVRRTQSGEAVANITVATNEKWTDKQTGERKEKAEFHKVAIWGKTAEVVEKYLSKGSKVYIEGKLKTEKWTDKQGIDKYTTKIEVKGFGGSLVMLGDKKSNNTDDQQDTSFDVPFEDDGDDIPF